MDDNISERIELFSLTLERTPDLDSRIILNPMDGAVTILDDDGKLIFMNAHIQKTHGIDSTGCHSNITIDHAPATMDDATHIHIPVNPQSQE